MLVGRESAVRRFRRRLLRSERRRGSALLIEGKPGSGRSRLLTTFLTEARLRGMLSLYADGEEGRKGPFAVARVLSKRLLECEPELSRSVASDPVLARLDLDTSLAEGPEAIEPDAWPAISKPLADRLIAVSARVGLAVGVDDLDQSDEASIAVLAKVAEAAPSRALLVLATARAGSSRSAVERFRQIGSSLALTPLQLSDTKALLSSVFGDAPSVEGISEWVHHLTEGNPESALELAQHLVAGGVAKA